MAIYLAIRASVLIAALVLCSKTLRGSVTWQTMTTPLASIIGSGFLVLGPILDSEYGVYVPLVMTLLCAGAYLFGAAIRYNMRYVDTDAPKPDMLSRGLDAAAWCRLHRFSRLLPHSFWGLWGQPHHSKKTRKRTHSDFCRHGVDLVRGLAAGVQDA